MLLAVRQIGCIRRAAPIREMNVSVKNIKRGLNVPIKGEVQQKIDPTEKLSRYYALKGRDFVGLKPTLLVKEGDRVKIGQPLFSNKKIEGVLYTSPCGGQIQAINRGDKREFLSIVIKADEKEEEVTFKKHDATQISSLSRQEVVEQLVKSGQWPLIKKRPFDKTPSLDEIPHSIFITSMDSNPLAMDVALLYSEKEAIQAGVDALSTLTEGSLHICSYPDKAPDFVKNSKVKHHSFKGKHPAGLPGTHIHFIDPVGPSKSVWHLPLSSVIAIGRLFLTGRVDLHRTVALGGYLVKDPRVIKTRVGAYLPEVLEGELIEEKDIRIVSGSILAGSLAMDDVLGYLGFEDRQISVIKEETKRYFFGMCHPGPNFFSIKNIFLSALTPGKRFEMTTTRHGSKRAIYPSGGYEEVMPLDIVPTILLRSIASRDVEHCLSLGILELSEEDLALCTFVCPGKNDHGEELREMLNIIEKEG